MGVPGVAAVDVEYLDESCMDEGTWGMERQTPGCGFDDLVNQT